MYSRARAPRVDGEAVGHQDEWTSQVSEDVDGWARHIRMPLDTLSLFL